MEIRRLTFEHAARCAELEELLFPGENPWTRDIFVVEFAQPNHLYLGVFDDDELLAYGGIAQLGPREDPEFEIHTIGVDPAQQRRGLGRLLMDQLMRLADGLDGEVFLEVRTDNEAAIAMYRSFGFEVIGERKGYYQPSGADAYTMKRPAGSDRRGV
ncbi:GNAT family acetyltransferase [Corynebacterium humireducens NBRC 106098 = DSM 45392]|uniref:GNAT family acetyltransferase n=1 Tax=Corynebacterium humireducens NBRC 106098 = DSM 45392 TaxID=1223515 RepID=A0A0B5D0F1_9CORY|nr:ribosomal protein S18-alanine N-acetyltransferase [Corynebacterium humireducens]AJE32285.1 GNAT family acetyltransferase [Corynebacterium humireducens NBRC 106098 = DSM 45392]